MAIAFSCPSCDRTDTIGDPFAGRVTACKGCGTRLVVPEVEDAPGPPPKPPPKPRARVVAVSPPTPPRPAPGRRPEAEEFEVVEDAPGRDRDAYADDAARYARKAARKQRRRERDAEVREQHGNGLAVSRTIVGGAAAMIFAVVWFGVGLIFGVVFYFPPILFFIGLVTLVRGLMGEES